MKKNEKKKYIYINKKKKEKKIWTKILTKNEKKKNTRKKGGNPQLTVVHMRTRGNPYEQRHLRSTQSKKGGGSSSFLHKYYSVRTHILLTLCDEVCRWSAAGRWFSPSIPVSSTNKTDLHDITKWNIVESDVKHHKPNQPTNQPSKSHNNLVSIFHTSPDLWKTKILLTLY